VSCSDSILISSLSSLSGLGSGPCLSALSGSGSCPCAGVSLDSSVGVVVGVVGGVGVGVGGAGGVAVSVVGGTLLLEPGVAVVVGVVVGGSVGGVVGVVVVGGRGGDGMSSLKCTASLLSMFYFYFLSLGSLSLSFVVSSGGVSLASASFVGVV
jgi:hypothetical protein